MIGVVVVSHSAALANAAIALAKAMVPEASGPVVLPAAGTGDGGLGTDATVVAEAIAEADSGEGVLVLVDLGSAVLSAEMAVEFIDPEVAQRVVISSAPLVEGLVVAVVAAASGAALTECEAQARLGLAAKEGHLVGGPAPATQHVPITDPDPPLTWSTVVDLPHGLHARPAASLAMALAGLEAMVTATNARTGATADALSAVDLMGLDIRDGDTLVASITGTHAAAARSVLERAAADRFGELR